MTFFLKIIFPFFLVFSLSSCSDTSEQDTSVNKATPEIQEKINKKEGIQLIVLGTVQDAGSPHAGCKKDCCKGLFSQPNPNRKVVSLGLIDYESQKNWMFEATPDLSTQMKLLKSFCPFQEKETPDGIFLTHAHIGHYAGLMYLGREAMNANGVAVYAMPKMKSFLEQNGPWSQLITLNNIQVEELKNETALSLNESVKIVPFTVPHRDEFSETVGYKIIGPNKSVLFVPDIDKWEKWDKNIIEELSSVDFAFLDATFYDAEEINNRNISEIPHPFIIESMSIFKNLPRSEKNKIYFIHLNHTNPALIEESNAYKTILEKGFHVAKIKGVFQL